MSIVVVVDKMSEHGNTKYPYKPEYCEKIIEFFSPPHFEQVQIQIANDVYKTEPKAKRPLFLSDFARSIGVAKGYGQLFSRWKKKYPEFEDALKEAKELEIERIRVNAEMGLYNSSFSIFTLKNIAGWRDKRDVEHSGEIKGQNPQIIIVRNQKEAEKIKNEQEGSNRVQSDGKAG